tara:strand:- start:214 stop:522 length:309 start_codon:yes stop_codon:yes gene_type:complete
MNKNDSFKILNEIFFIINQRKKKKIKGSYTSKLFKEGNKKIAQKVVEEASELVIDYLKGSKKRTIEEACDLLYHVLVLLSSKNISPNEIKKELEFRLKKYKQ